MFDEAGMAMFDPWELINTMDQLKQQDPVLANQIGMGLDKMGYSRDVVTNAMASGSPLPPPMRLGMGGDVPGLNDMGMVPGAPNRAYPEPGPPVPEAPRMAPQGGGESVPPDMTSAAPSFIPPISLGGLSMPTAPPPDAQAPAPAGVRTGSVPINQPPAPGVDARTQAQRAMAANQGFKAPVEQKPQIQDIRQAPAAPKIGDIKPGSPAIQMLLAAALSGGGGPQNPLRVPALGSLVGRR